jgi:hypothetical protein
VGAASSSTSASWSCRGGAQALFGGGCESDAEAGAGQFTFGF